MCTSSVPASKDVITKWPTFHALIFRSIYIYNQKIEATQMNVSSPSPPPRFYFLALITFCISPAGCLAHTPAHHSLRWMLPQLQLTWETWKAFFRSEHIKSTLLSCPFTGTNKGTPHLQKPTWVASDRSDRPPQQFVCWLRSCLPFYVQERSSLVLPTKPVSSWRMILHHHFPLAPSFCWSDVCSATYYFHVLAEMIMSCYGFVH